MTWMEGPDEPATGPDPGDDPSPSHVPWPLRLLLISSLLLLLLAAGAEWNRQGPLPSPRGPATPGPDDRTVLPGYRVGFIVLGLPVAEVEARLHKGVIRPSENAMLYLFQSAGLSCGVQEGKVISIEVRSPEYRTRGGIGIGADVDQVIREFGDHYEWDGKGASPTPGGAPTQSYLLHYWSDGIHFTVKGTAVEAIQITGGVEG